MKCPYCGKKDCDPAVVSLNCISYGSGRFNFKCLYCSNVVSVYGKREVVFGTPEKTNNESDWD